MHVHAYACVFIILIYVYFLRQNFTLELKFTYGKLTQKLAIEDPHNLHEMRT